MKEHSRKLIHIGINHLLSPRPSISQERIIAFQQAIINNGLEFSQLNRQDDRIILIRENPSPLHITIISSNQPVGQLIVVAPHPKTPLDLFVKEAEAVCVAFDNVWSSHNRQIIGGDTTIRELHETTSQHAFQELWEKRLGQQPNSLAVFERPIRGGGLRFVLDPVQSDADPSQIEVKVESYLNDTNKIFVEIQTRWQNSQPSSSFDINGRIQEANSFLTNKVHKFILGES